MPPETQRSPGSLRSSAAADSHASTLITIVGPTWYLNARPLKTCHDHDEYAIECPKGDHEALAWRSRLGERGGGWACPQGHRGQLWQLLGAVA